MVPFDGLLVIRQNQTVHREIETLLEMMRAANVDKVAGAGAWRTIPQASEFQPARASASSDFEPLQPRNELQDTFGSPSQFEPTTTTIPKKTVEPEVKVDDAAP
jgi:hypothetical protein